MELCDFINFEKWIDICNYEINLKIFWIFIILLIIILFFITLFIILIISYFIFKIFRINIENNNVFFNDYNKKTQEIINKYGNYKISKIYIIKEPLGNLTKTLLNIITLYEYQCISEENDDFTIYHASIIIKIKLPNKLTKFLLIEKNPNINISERFNINNLQNIKSLCIKKQKYTLNKILKLTNNRIGNEKFFNWHFYKNNCQEFVREILITLQNPNYIDDFMSHKKISKLLYSSKFNVYTINVLVTLSNIMEKIFF